MITIIIISITLTDIKVSSRDKKSSACLNFVYFGIVWQLNRLYDEFSKLSLAQNYILVCVLSGEKCLNLQSSHMYLESAILVAPDIRFQLAALQQFLRRPAQGAGDRRGIAPSAGTCLISPAYVYRTSNKDGNKRYVIEPLGTFLGGRPLEPGAENLHAAAG